MTALTDTPPTQPSPVRTSTGHSVDPTIRQRVRRNRALAGAGVVVIIGAFVVVLGSGSRGGYLDPRSYDHDGAHALSVLLDKRGVQVTTETDPVIAVQAAKAGSTLVVVTPQLLTDEQLGAIASASADLVVVGAGLDELQGLRLAVGDELGDSKTLRSPECSLPAAVVAGTAELRGDGYSVPRGGQGCYPDGDGHALVTVTTGNHRVTLLSDGTALTNVALGRQGNAALALGLLNTHPDVVWLVPHVIAPLSGSQPPTSVSDLLPDRLKAAVFQLVIAIVIIGLWRGRRLGRLVPETLPVVVRQSETVRGRSRLYRRSRSLERAADALRDGTRDRLGHRLGQGPRPVPGALVQAVAARVQQPSAQIESLLYGSTPADDRALVTLAQALSALEQEVLQT